MSDSGIGRDPVDVNKVMLLEKRTHTMTGGWNQDGVNDTGERNTTFSLTKSTECFSRR